MQRTTTLGWRLLTRRIAPAILLTLTLFTTFTAGGGLSGGDRSLWSGLSFALCAMVAVGAHAFGHFIAARRCGVDASFPYFVPQLGIVGTSGAYVKLSWPIEDRRSLIRIFVAGPMVGFLTSTVVLAIALYFSERVSAQPDNSLKFGDSLLTIGLQKLLFPGLATNEDILLHPVGLAGYAGLYFNLGQLFPAGRLDGGRVAYALLGYRRALIVSWGTIVALIALGYFSPVWPGIGIFAALTLIRLKHQHASEQSEDPIDPTSMAWALAMFAVLILTFVPVPVRATP
jgi:Peptidase family M50